MSAIVDYEFYSETYMGSEADEASFPALCARAEDIIGGMTRWKITEENLPHFPALTQTLFKKAVCAQVDFLAINGLEAVQDTSGGGGFTVGKVNVQARATSALSGAGALSGAISPMAISYLEQTGLMNPAVPVMEWW